MNITLDRACSPARPTLYCIGIHVDPTYQQSGVGGALVGAATGLADTCSAAMWAHLSDAPGGVALFEKNGFEEVNTVTVDLDEYASRPKAGGKWGTYSQHCMFREPRAS